MKIIVRNKETYKGLGEAIHRPSPKGQVKGSVLGNPYHMADESQRTEVIRKYKSWLWRHIQAKTPQLMEELDRLYKLAVEQEELNLICWCAPKACHGDVIKAYIEWRYSNEQKNQKQTKETTSI